MKRKIYKDPNNSKNSKFRRKRYYQNDHEASTSTNINFEDNHLEKSNTEFLTGVRVRSIRLLSSYNNNRQTSNSLSDNYSLPSFQESNFFIIYYYFFLVINFNKIFS